MERINVPEIISELDRLFAAGKINEAAVFMEQWLERARKSGDWSASLSFLSELLGIYRRNGENAKAAQTVSEALELIERQAMGHTVSAATVMLNAATTLKAIGRAAESIPIFHKVQQVYINKLPESDYRWAGLYNNMALSYGDMGEHLQAESFFIKSLEVLEALPDTENDRAACLCNMAELYAAENSEDERIDQCMEKAWQLLNMPGLKQDGYHAFVISKCLSSFDYFGYFLYAKELRERAEKIYARP